MFNFLRIFKKLMSRRVEVVTEPVPDFSRQMIIINGSSLKESK